MIVNMRMHGDMYMCMRSCSCRELALALYIASRSHGRGIAKFCTSILISIVYTIAIANKFFNYNAHAHAYELYIYQRLYSNCIMITRSSTADVCIDDARTQTAIG